MASDEQAKIKLHWLNGSRAQTILWLLEELKVSYDIDVYHRQRSKLAPLELEKIHPLGKAPVITVTPPGEGAEPFVLAESSFIVQWLCDHYAQGTNLVPQRWKDGQEGKVGGETESWMRYQYLMYYIEGTLFPNLVMYVVMASIKGPQVPFFIRPISGLIAGKVTSMLIFPNLKRNLQLLESYLESVPGGGDYICGPHLTAADIMLGFPLMGSKDGLDDMGAWDKGTPRATYPKLWAYIDRLEKEPGFLKSADKILEVDGKFELNP